MLTPHPSQPAFSNSHAPLTPRAPKSSRGGDGDETEMRLLSEVDGQAGMDQGMDMDMVEDETVKVAKKPLSLKDKQGMALLSVLCEY